MKQLVLLVEKSKRRDILKFQNVVTSIYDPSGSTLGGLHFYMLIFSTLIR